MSRESVRDAIHTGEHPMGAVCGYCSECRCDCFVFVGTCRGCAAKVDPASVYVRVPLEVLEKLRDECDELRRRVALLEVQRA